MVSATRRTRSVRYSVDSMSYSGQAQYFDGLSPLPVSGVLTATADALIFESDLPGGTPIRFAYAQVSETNGDASGCRVEIFIDAAESRELRFADPELLRQIARYRDASASGLRRAVHTFAAWSVGRRILVGALLLPVSLGVYLFRVERAHVVVPRFADQRLGAQASTYLNNHLEFCDDAQLNAALDEILTRLVGPDARSDYSIRVVRDAEVNALALPNGNIYIFSGLLAESESATEVAGVIAHEIGHIRGRHSIRQLIQALGVSYMATMVLGAGFEEFESAETISELASLAVFLKYSRGFEREADLDSIDTLRAAELDPRGLQAFFERRLDDRQDSTESVASTPISLEDVADSLPDFLSSHPADAERLEYLKAALAANSAGGVAEDLTVRPLAVERDWAAVRARCANP